MKRPDVIIVGAGPAGLKTAEALEGYNILVFEARRKPGRPPHCAGIVSIETARHYPREAIRDYYDGLTVVTKRGVLDIDVRLVRLDRPLLEDILVESISAEMVTGEAVVSVDPEGRGFRIVTSKGGVYRARVLVDAEGASARISQMLGFARCRKLVGVQALAYAPMRVGEQRPVVFMRQSGRVNYAWIAPVDNGRKLLVGAVAGNARTAYNHTLWMIRRLGVNRLIEWRTGLIPYDLPPRRLCRGKGGVVCVVGDAACASKATSGGGLYAIARMAPCIREYLEKGRCSRWTGIRRNLYRHYAAARLYYDTPLRAAFELLAGLVRRVELLSYDELRVGGVVWRVSRCCAR